MAARIMVFGGTFDPVHIGHVQIARALGRGVGAERILLVPTGVNPLKSPPVASGEDRLAMLKLAVRGDDLFEISELELNRRPPIYTMDTIEALHQKYGPETTLYLAMGADMLADLPRWHRAADLLRQVHLAVACRPPVNLPGVEKALSDLAGVMKARGLAEIHAQAVPTPMLEIASSDIRNRLAKGLPVESFVQKDVMKYIREKGFYGGMAAL
ncbi:MAG: nicotinate (nicotinamide) nucleotide adenylyltransferase [Phycisphaerae bacterium]|nr:nicotinate (nicotinamide) nucleotide adenylyltransferase [Phycisphaerae bacterium]